MAEPSNQRSTSPQQELPQDVNNSSFQGMEGKGEHENNTLTDSDPVTEDEQPSTASNAGVPLSLPPRRAPYPEPQESIEKLSSTTNLSYEEDIKENMLTCNAYQINDSCSSPHSKVVNYAINDQYLAGIHLTDQNKNTTFINTYPTTEPGPIAFRKNGHNSV